LTGVFYFLRLKKTRFNNFKDLTMKMFLITMLSIFASVSTYASSASYVACRAANSDEYDISIEFVNNKISSVSTLESDFKYYTKVESHDIFSVIYSTEYDTNLGYDLSTTQSTPKEVYLINWSSGNDSDNYYAVPTSSKVECHLLKSKPVNSILVSGNIEGYVAVQNL
jgi:hypothetical protein